MIIVTVCLKCIQAYRYFLIIPHGHSLSVIRPSGGNLFRSCRKTPIFIKPCLNRTQNSDHMHPLSLRILILVSVIHLFGLHSFAQNERLRPTCPLNIVIALDFSGSEWTYLDEIRTVLHALTSPFELNETNLKIGIITFNRGARVVLPLTGDTQALDAAIDNLNMVRMVYATDIHAAIALAGEEFRQHSEAGIPKYFVLISDGDPHAHSRGFGFQADLVNIEQLKLGDPEADVDPVHVFTLYTGRLSPYQNRFSEAVRKASIHHMKVMASDEQSFFYFEQYPMLVEFFERISNCL